MVEEQGIRTKDIVIRAFPALDGLRGIAAILVAIYHYRGDFIGFRDFPAGDGYLAVDLFFVLSGYVLSHAYLSRFQRGMSVSQFMRARLIRLYPLYFVGLIVGTISFIAGLEPGSNLTNGSITKTLMLEAFMLPSWPKPGNPLFVINPVAWSLFFEFIVNCLFVLCWKRLGAKTLLTIIVASAVALAVFTVRRHSANFGISWNTLMVGFPRTFLSFGLGLLIAQGHRSGKLQMNVSAAALLAGIALMVGYLIFPVSETVRAYYDLMFILIISPALVIIGTSKHLANRWVRVFSFLGGVSYALYAIHATFIPLLRVVGLRYFKGSPAIWIALIDVAFLVGLSYLLDIVYDQPVRRALTSYFRNKNPPPPLWGRWWQ